MSRASLHIVHEPRPWPFMSSDPRMVGSDTPRCEKCGAEITTGLMAVFCQRGSDCAFVDEQNADSVGFFREAFGTAQL